GARAPAPRESLPVLPSAVVPVSGTAPTPAPPARSLVASEPTGVGPTLARTFLPERTFTSELPSIAGGIAAGTAVAPLMPWAVPLAAGAGSSAGEAARGGYEQLTGQGAAEPGTLTARMGRGSA